MKTTKVYDTPTRIFHWLFAGLALGAFAIAKLVDDESVVFSYHMLMGLVLAFAVTFRTIWGFVGSRYARFSSFRLAPCGLIDYFGRLVTGRAERELGHNPASSWAALTMIILAMGLALTGYMMASGGGNEPAEEVHELLANLLIVVAVGHVGGVVFHSLRHRDRIALSMIHGGKKPVEGEAGIPHSYRGVGVIFVALVVGFALYLGRNYDPVAQDLNLLGIHMQLGEVESSGGAALDSSGDIGDDD